MTIVQQVRTLMVVDKSPATLASMLTEAQGRGLSVITADDPTIALASFEHAMPDVVVTDLYAPDMGGLTLARQIKARCPSCPVIVLTELVSEEAAIQALRAGVADYLHKPVSADMLWSAVCQTLKTIPQYAESVPGVERVEHLLVVEPEPAHVERIVNVILSTIGVPIPEPRRGHLRAALHELLLNAVEHGSLEMSFRAKQDALANDAYDRLVEDRRRDSSLSSRRVRIRIVYARDEKMLEFRIADEGKGFRWKTLLKRERNPVGSGYGCGRGLFVTKAFFSDLSYNDKGNEAILRVPVL